MSTQGGVFFLPDIFPGEVCLSSFSLFYVFNIIRVTGAVRVVGNNRADDAAHYQCANPVTAVHAAMAAMMVMTRRGCRVVPLNDGTAVADGAAFVHHRLRFVARTAVTDGAAFVHHRLCFVARTAVTDGAAFVHHGLRLVARTALMHGLHSLSRCAFMNGRSYMVAGTLSLHRGFHLMTGGAFPCFRTDLLGLCRGSAAAGTGCCRLGYAHYERSA